MKLITISGLDGSGKTSQLNFLSDYLKDKGKKVFMFHAVKSSLATRIYQLIPKNSNAGVVQAVTSASTLTIFLRKVILMADIFLFRNLFKKLEKEKYDYILSDRYFHDQIVNIHFLKRKQTLDTGQWWSKFTIKHMKKPDISLLLEVSPLTVLARERKIEQGADYLKQKFSLYEQLARNAETKHFLINGEQSKGEVHEDIRKKLGV